MRMEITTIARAAVVRNVRAGIPTKVVPQKLKFWRGVHVYIQPYPKKWKKKSGLKQKHSKRSMTAERRSMAQDLLAGPPSPRA